MKRTQILEISKIVIYEFCYDYVKPNYGKNAKLRYLDTGSLIVYIKIDDIFKDAGDVETKFDTSNFELNRPNKNVIGVMKDELAGKIVKKLVESRAKTYIYIIADGDEDKKAKGTKTCVKKTKN